MGPQVNLFLDLGRDDRLILAPRAGHAGVHVGHALLKTETPQGAAQGDSLFELPVLRLFHFPIEFLLARQHNLKHLAAPVLDIAQQSDLFQYFPIQIVSLVHDQYGGSSRQRPFDQHVIESYQHFRFRMPVAVEFEIVRKHLKKLRDRQPGVEQ